MRILDVVQGSPEWVAARLGIPTASRFDSILTPKTRKPSASQAKYLCELLAERFVGFPMGPEASAFMERGSSLEADAVTAYEFAHDCDTRKVGVILSDCGRWACSPDRLVGDEGLAEFKCLAAQNHVAALLGEKDVDHFAQAQGQLWIAGREWVDLNFYNPVLPSHEVRFGRDEEFIGLLAEEVEAFAVRLDEAEKALRATHAFADKGKSAA